MKEKRKIKSALLGSMMLLCAPSLFAAGFENRWVSVDFDDKGRLVSLREKKSGRELIAAKRPFAEVVLAGGERLSPTSLSVDPKRLRFGFGEHGELTLSVRPFDDGWTLTTESFTVKDAENLVFAQVTPLCSTHKGLTSNIVCDDLSAVAVRGYTPDIDMPSVVTNTAIAEYAPDDRTTCVSVNKRFGFTGKSAGLSVGPRSDILNMLKTMTVEAGVPRTDCGGAWSEGAEANRNSYLFAAFMDYASLDDWIRLLDKAGCSMLHFHLWWKTRGSYDVSPACFPGGLKELVEAVERVHAAGKLASTHTLSAAIEFGDRYVSPEWFDQYVTSANYTLARPYREGDTELYVNERPWSGHSRTLNGGNNGNVLRIGDDLLQYTDFTTNAPYRFTGVHIAREPWGDFEVWDPTQTVTSEFDDTVKAKRPARRLSRKGYPAGFAVDYLHHRYGEFYAKVGSELAERLTDEIADKFNACKFDGIFFDGAEGQPGRYERDVMTKRTFEKFKSLTGSIINSRSISDPYNWWFRSLQGTWDYPNYDPRTFFDRHIRVFQDRNGADFMALDLGWVKTCGPRMTGRGYYPEEMEYIGCKSAANDATISVNGAQVSDGPIGYSMDDQLTLFGWWSRARYARAFKADLQSRMKRPGDEWRLRQNRDGEWQVQPFKAVVHSVRTPDAASWTIDAPSAESVELRVAALYAVDETAAKTNTVRVIDAAMLPSLERETAKGVVMTAAASSDPLHGETIRIAARNEGAPQQSSWARLSRVMSEGRTFDANAISTLWIKGDGSGATLNVQLRRSAEKGLVTHSENLVKLDFVGWRKFSLCLRERDADESAAFDWPYDDKHRLNTQWCLYRPQMIGDSIDRASFWLNGIPAGKTVTVEVGAWDSVPMMRGTLRSGAKVAVNGKDHVVPFEMAGGEYAELKDGFWMHYAESGEMIGRIAHAEPLTFKTGTNSLLFTGTDTAGNTARAEVTLFLIGEGEAAFGRLSSEQKRKLAVEYERPQIFSPAEGLDGRFDVRVRPGEKARLGFEIYGPVVNPAVCGRKMNVTLRDSFDKIVSTDGRTWEAVRITPGKLGYEARISAPERTRLAGGMFETPLPLLTGGTTVVDVSADAAKGTRVTFFKRYLTDEASTSAHRTDWAAGSYHYLMNEMSRASRGQEFDFVVFGDSITMGWIYPAADKGWPGGREVWERNFGRLKTANFGVSGDRTEHLLWRIEKAGQADGWKAKKIFVAVGANNLGQRGDTPEETFQGTKAIVKALRERHPESVICVIGTTPRKDMGAMGATSAWVREYNELLKTLAGGPVRVYDIGEAFKTNSGEFRAELFRDGLHPNPAGYEVYAAELQKILKNN